MIDPEILRIEMAKQRLTAKELAKKIGLSTVAVYKITKNGYTKLVTAKKIADFLQIPLESLLTLKKPDKSINIDTFNEPELKYSTKNESSKTIYLEDRVQDLEKRVLILESQMKNMPKP